MTSLSALRDLPEKFAVNLTESMLISLNGEQADSYLHGQITVNINKLDNNIARHYAHCDNKGKTWSTGYVTRFAQQLLMLTNAASGNHSLAQLNKYGVFSKVDILDTSEDFDVFYISQSAVDEVLGNSFPDADFNTTVAAEDVGYAKFENSEHGVVFSSGLVKQGVIAILTHEAAKDLKSKLSNAEIACYPQHVFDALQIESAHPSLGEQTVAEYIPQMMNVQALNGIDFDKGCYMGQEVVARTRFLGKNKRAAYSFSIDEPVDVCAGDTLEKQLGENWRVAGTVISVAKLDGETWFMAVLSNDTTPEDLHRLADHHAITCYPYSLPYSIEQQASNIVKKRR